LDVSKEGFSGVESNIVKTSYYGIIAVLIVVMAIALAGCTASKTTGTMSDSSGSTGTASSSSPAAAATTTATCPTLSTTGAGMWNGTWSALANANKCADMRGHFNPPVKGVDQWQPNFAGEYWMNTSFTQNGCDVTGTGTVSGPFPASTNSCPVTFTGTASGTSVTGTWKAYCSLSFGTGGKQESGIWDLYMDPTNNGFAGTFTCDTDTCRKSIAANCPTANGNWVGKRIS
jgi:hypothetical protein